MGDLAAMARPEPRIEPLELPVRLSLGAKLLYGFGDINIAIRLSAFQFYLLPFYTDVVLLAPWLAGFGKMIGFAWDGINDPVTGYLSDRTRTRLGRRRPFLLGAAIPLGCGFALIWSAPAGMSQGAGFLYLVAAYLFLDTAFSLYATPYLALGAELSPDYHERTQLQAARGLFHVIGLTVGGVLPWFIVGRYTDAHAGYRAMGIGMGAGCAVVAIVTGVVLRERPRAQLAEPPHSLRLFAQGFSTTVKNRAFRVMLTAFGFILVGGGLHQTMLPYAFKYWLGQSQERTGEFIALYLISSVLSLPVWTRLARVFGKDQALRGCMLWSVCALFAMPIVFTPEAGFVRMGMFLLVAGVGNGGWAVLPPAITADIVDLDELETGRRREGAYFGVWTLVMKLAQAVASGVVGVALQMLSFQPNQEQMPHTLLGIRLLYGPVPAAFILMAFFVFLAFPLTREKHRALQATLVARRGGGAS